MNKETLVQQFENACRPSERWLIGAELERHLLRPDGLPVSYSEDFGVQWLLQKLRDDGWAPQLEGDHIIALTKDGASVTLEPGGQFELSGAPFASVAEVHAEAIGFRDEVHSHLQSTPVTQTAIGFTPFASVPKIPWVPKGRYRIMREHLGETGALAHHMMKGTCATQASYDFSSEQTCSEMVQLATAMGPITTALFANSPYSEGTFNGFMSFRGKIWTKTDPARTGLPDAAASFSFSTWVDYLLDAPMMFLKEGGKWHFAEGRTFRRWMASDTPPTMADWELHQTSVFPEVRVKAQIEVRGADCVDIAHASAFAALFEGLFYDHQARDQANELLASYAHCGTRERRFLDACEHGLRAEAGGKALAVWAGELVDIAKGGLQRWQPEDEAFLLPLVGVTDDACSPARKMLEVLGKEPTPEELIRYCAL